MTPLDGGRSKISSPRRAGGGHGDVVSALVLACWVARAAPSPTTRPRFPVGGHGVESGSAGWPDLSVGGGGVLAPQERHEQLQDALDRNGWLTRH